MWTYCTLFHNDDKDIEDLLASPHPLTALDSLVLLASRLACDKKLLPYAKRIVRMAEAHPDYSSSHKLMSIMSYVAPSEIDVQHLIDHPGDLSQLMLTLANVASAQRIHLKHKQVILAMVRDFIDEPSDECNKVWNNYSLFLLNAYSHAPNKLPSLARLLPALRCKPDSTLQLLARIDQRSAKLPVEDLIAAFNPTILPDRHSDIKYAADHADELLDAKAVPKKTRTRKRFGNWARVKIARLSIGLSEEQTKMLLGVIVLHSNPHSDKLPRFLDANALTAPEAVTRFLELYPAHLEHCPLISSASFEKFLKCRVK